MKKWKKKNFKNSTKIKKTQCPSTIGINEGSGGFWGL